MLISAVHAIKTPSPAVCLAAGRIVKKETKLNNYSHFGVINSYDFGSNKTSYAHIIDNNEENYSTHIPAKFVVY
jgi:hypothetical protein